MNFNKNHAIIIYNRINTYKQDYSLFTVQTSRYITLYNYTNSGITEIIRYMQDVHSKFLEVGFIPNEELERLNSKINAFKSFYESIPRKVRPE
ncbi:hypothetical protein [Bacillus sp. OAE603]|uniref:hypothetical protein n=1 Tax=Gottfriedia sp. OAE603 TaxID=2663872 RepID=UPI00178B4CE5